MTALSLVPEPEYPGMPAALVYSDDGRADDGLEGRTVDDQPLSRGVHAVDRWYFDPTICGLQGGEDTWGPPPGSPTPPRDTALGLSGDQSDPPTWRVRALMLSGEDPGADADADAWSAMFEELGAALRHVHRPSPEGATQAVDNLCTGADGDISVVLVLSGRAVAGATPGLLLNDRTAVSYQDLATALVEGCGAAGLTVVVVDAGFSGGTFREMPLSPRIVWQASDAATPMAPRIEPAGGGLLSGALAPLVAQRAEELCLGTLPSVTELDGTRVVHATPDEVARTFQPSMEVVLGDMKSLRLERVAGTAEPAPVLEALLLEDIPEAIFRRSTATPDGGRCTEDGHCGATFFGCELAPCETWRCVEQRCVVALSDGLCDDQNPCTHSDYCLAGQCVGETLSCDDDNPCTVDICSVETGCEHLPYAEPEPCDDQDPCTDLDACGPGGACTGEPLDCDDANPCTEDSCDSETGECVYDTAVEACDDGDPCTHQDYCQAGVCKGLAIQCDDGDPCTTDTCDAVSGECLYPSKSEGSPCEDLDPCTLADTCQAGLCVGTLAACDDGLSCTLDTCDSDNGACTYLPAPGTCASSLGCIGIGESPLDDPCQLCIATNTFGPTADGAPCPDDGIECTSDVCAAGQCEHLDEPGFCHTAAGLCVPSGQALGPCLNCGGGGVATPVASGNSCDDSDPCTLEDACTGDGFCAGALQACCGDDLGSPGTCGETVSGTTTGGVDAVSNYSCNSSTYDGPEAFHQFVAPCAGQVLITFEGPPNMSMFLVRGDLDTCAAGSCESATPVAFYPVLAEGELITIVVDGSNSASGAYTITLSCLACP